VKATYDVMPVELVSLVVNFSNTAETSFGSNKINVQYAIVTCNYTLFIDDINKVLKILWFDDISKKI
jgi:hypothetical protein